MESEAWWYVEEGGHLFVLFYLSSKVRNDGAMIQARRICLRCGAVRWRAVESAKAEHKVVNGRKILRFRKPKERGEVTLPFGQVPLWTKRRLRNAPELSCEPNGDRPWLIEATQALQVADEQQRIARAASAEVERLENQAMDLIKASLGGLFQSAQKEMRTSERARKVKK